MLSTTPSYNLCTILQLRRITGAPIHQKKVLDTMIDAYTRKIISNNASFSYEIKLEKEPYLFHRNHDFFVYNNANQITLYHLINSIGHQKIWDYAIPMNEREKIIDLRVSPQGVALVVVLEGALQNQISVFKKCHLLFQGKCLKIIYLDANFNYTFNVIENHFFLHNSIKANEAKKVNIIQVCKIWENSYLMKKEAKEASDDEENSLKKKRKLDEKLKERIIPEKIKMAEGWERLPDTEAFVEKISTENFGDSWTELCTFSDKFYILAGASTQNQYTYIDPVTQEKVPKVNRIPPQLFILDIFLRRKTIVQLPDDKKNPLYFGSLAIHKNNLFCGIHSEQMFFDSTRIFNLQIIVVDIFKRTIEDIYYLQQEKINPAIQTSIKKLAVHDDYIVFILSSGIGIINRRTKEQKHIINLSTQREVNLSFSGNFLHISFKKPTSFKWDHHIIDLKDVTYILNSSYKPNSTAAALQNQRRTFFHYLPTRELSIQNHRLTLVNINKLTKKYVIWVKDFSIADIKNIGYTSSDDESTELSE